MADNDEDEDPKKKKAQLLMIEPGSPHIAPLLDVMAQSIINESASVKKTPLIPKQVVEKNLKIAQQGVEQNLQK